ncbi:MAG: site-specific DNA-methyltransferase [Lactobacillales bacterium]|jgi:modification methylase|nr:site-specific DNA-methyltransferase [Lactobacillales bacterium]
MIPINSIINADCIHAMKRLPDKCVDLIFADPPYFMQLSKTLHRPDATEVGAVDDLWDKFGSFEEYDDFTVAWLKEARRVLKDNGTLWVIGSYHNIFRIGYHLQNMGFWVLNDIIWVKINPMPNFKGTRFTNAHETLIWCSKNPKSKYTFHYDSMKNFNDDLQMRSDWHLPICIGRERLKKETGQKVHTTQKPESLLYRIILSTTQPGDVVLDPFFGTGTSGAVAKKLGRHFIGIEKNKEYIRPAQKRIKDIATSEEEYTSPLVKKPEPRISFGSLLEHHLLKAGDKLYRAKGTDAAVVCADGTLLYKRKKASIHLTGAHIMGVSSCNGWLFWHYKDKKTKKMIPIDTLREQLKSKLFTKKESV